MSDQIEVYRERLPVLPPKEKWRVLTPSLWIGFTAFEYFQWQLHERGSRENKLGIGGRHGGTEDGVAIIATVVRETTGQSTLKVAGCVGDPQQHCCFIIMWNPDGYRFDIQPRHEQGGRLADKSRELVSRKIDLPDTGLNSVHSAKVYGNVVEHTDKAMIVHFNLGGLTEERAFWWDEVKLEREQVPVGTKVIGIARLVKAPEMANNEDGGKATREIHEAVEREMAELDPEASKPLGYGVSPEENAKTVEDWKRIMSSSSRNTKDGLREG